MIVYAATRAQFTEDVYSNHIERRILDAFRSRHRRSIAESEVRAWTNSMQYMNNVLVDGRIPEDAGVAIEYTIPQTAKRIDFILTGMDPEEQDTAVIVELKQWSEARKTDKDAVVETFEDVVHQARMPSLEAIVRTFAENNEESNQKRPAEHCAEPQQQRLPSSQRVQVVPCRKGH